MPTRALPPEVYPPPPPAAQVVYTTPTQVVVVATPKDPRLAALLGFLFGPLGLLYATVPGAVVMFLVSLVVGLLTLGLGLVLLWPVSALVGYQAAQSHNQRIALAQPGYPGYPAFPGHSDPLDPAATLSHPPGWYPDPYRQARIRYWDGAAWTGHTA